MERRTSMTSWLVRWADPVILGVAVLGLAIGAVSALVGAHDAADTIWTVTSAFGVGLSAWWVIDAARHRRLGVDVLAVLALVGTLVVGEYLAGAVITVMLASGRTLEARAAARAAPELHALLAHAPRMVHRYDDGELTIAGHRGRRARRPAARPARRGRPGRRTPRAEAAVLDESALTGEPLPVERASGTRSEAGA